MIQIVLLWMQISDQDATSVKTIDESFNKCASLGLPIKYRSENINNKKISLDNFLQEDIILFYLPDHNNDLTTEEHPHLLIDIEDKDGDHRYPHSTLKGKYIGVLTNVEMDCTICPSVYLNLCNLGAQELIDYDFYNCLTDKTNIVSAWTSYLLTNIIYLIYPSLVPLKQPIKTVDSPSVHDKQVTSIQPKEETQCTCSKEDNLSKECSCTHSEDSCTCVGTKSVKTGFEHDIKDITIAPILETVRSLLPIKVKRRIQLWYKEKEERELDQADEGDIEDLAFGEDEIVNGENEQLTPSLRKILTKQGYVCVGTHSAVKLCRWTKTHLRGNGACYKHTFYGLNSASCMEATSSLACANRCLFCWRHHSNPTGREWKWKEDNAEDILPGMIQGYQKLLRIFGGSEGVDNTRLKEAMGIKHCALSLIGEPIMYPQINKLIDLLHEHHTSSFLVSNSQFPDELLKLNPVTQLYLSLDGSTPAGLRKLDRPLFRDYWERFLKSIQNLSQRKERTVLRITLVKGYNMDDIEGVAKLAETAQPSFIELKGMTFSGQGCRLSMENCPWHSEVKEYGVKLASLLDDYELCCEHAHSCSVLITHKKFHINGEWYTWIDFDKFQSLYKVWKEEGKEFSALDYSIPTPSWAIYGSNEEGFDPRDTRIKRVKKE